MANRLASQSSPYLRQHQDNPVDWWPWGEEALAAAKAEKKPILLSVGYAACHWCHVMAHESFENQEIAALMNEHFINIKVDREERPDLDAVYQAALSLMGIQGGWPLTMFLDANGEPFAGGTYFPPRPRYGRPGFEQILQQVAQIWLHEPGKIENSRAQIMSHLSRVLNPSGHGSLSAETISSAVTQFTQQADTQHGGMGEAPKFPNTTTLSCLWRDHLNSNNEEAGLIVVKALTHMCQGGLYDHLGGGFARYSVDAAWLVPHFEKMLYDNALLVSLLTDVWLKTREPLFSLRIEETIAWLQREMSVSAGYAASLDADSEGEEGKFYVWSEDEITACLGDDASFFGSVYDVTPEGNFEGKSILNRLNSLDLRDAAQEARLQTLRERLLAVREKRIRPGRDDKILTDWNALAIEAIAKAGLAFQSQDWLALARSLFDRILTRHGFERDGLLFLLHSSLDGTDGPAGMAEDYAYMASAGLLLFQASGDTGCLDVATRLMTTLETKFAADEGGFFQSADDAHDVIVRSRPIYDNAVPPANGTMAANYVRANALTGDPQFAARADALFTSFGNLAKKVPVALPSLLNALSDHLNPMTVVLCTPGSPPVDWQNDPLTRAVWQLPDAAKSVLWSRDPHSLSTDHPAYGKTAQDGKLTAYVCRGRTCSPPVTSAAELNRAILL